MLAIVAVASIVFAQFEIEDFGLIRLITPMALPLLLPALAGVGAVTACENTARLALPDPARAAVARFIWAVSWTLLAFAAAGAAGLVNPETNLMAIARNLLVYVAIGLLTLRSGFPHLVWLPVLAYTITCMMFGYDRAQHDYYPWAVIMKNDVSSGQLLAILPMAAAALLVYALRFRR